MRLLPLLLLLALPLSAQGRDCDGYLTPLVVPAGFCVRPFAEKVGPVRHLVVHPTGVVIAATKLAPGLVALSDTSGDGVADVVTRFGPGEGGTGLAWRAGFLYFAADIGVFRLPWPATSRVPTGAGEWIIERLPAGGGGYAHYMKGIVAATDGSLLVSIGSASDNCQATAGEYDTRVPGQWPCPELSTRAGIWRFVPPASGKGPWVGSRYATGLRNAMAMTQDPVTRSVWALSHGRDFLNRYWGASDEESADQPGEVLVRLASGADFGWPYCMARWRPNAPTVLMVAPEYASQPAAACATRTQPTLGFPGHWAPMAVTTATEAMPDGWRRGLLIAFHGSRSRAPLPEAGHQLLYQPFDAAGRPAGEPRILLRSGDRPGTLRLAGVAVAPNGMVYLADDDFGRIIRIERR